jgi:hypothetical protein
VAPFVAEVVHVEPDHLPHPQPEVGQDRHDRVVAHAGRPVSASAAASSESTSDALSPTVAEWSRSTRGRSAPPTGFAATLPRS